MFYKSLHSKTFQNSYIRMIGIINNNCYISVRMTVFTRANHALQANSQITSEMIWQTEKSQTKNQQGFQIIWKKSNNSRQ